jgi:hypothetical protein
MNAANVQPLVTAGKMENKSMIFTGPPRFSATRQPRLPGCDELFFRAGRSMCGVPATDRWRDRVTMGGKFARVADLSGVLQLLMWESDLKEWRDAGESVVVRRRR